MSTVRITDDHLHVRFTAAERVGGLVRDQRIPLAAVVSAEVVESPITEVRGLRAPGLALPGVRKVGTWRRFGGKELICVRKDEPAVRIELSGQPYAALLLGTDDAAQVAAQLQRCAA
jgi:hypothetical protein